MDVLDWPILGGGDLTHGAGVWPLGTLVVGRSRWGCWGSCADEDGFCIGDDLDGLICMFWRSFGGDVMSEGT